MSAWRYPTDRDRLDSRSPGASASVRSLNATCSSATSIPFRRPRRGEQLEIHESALPLALSAAEDFTVPSFGGEFVPSFGGEVVPSFGGEQALDPTIPSTLLFGGTVLDSKIVLTHNDKIGRCVVTGTGYAALLDLTIKERYATDARCHLR